jgi:hypothetical protein
MILGKQWSIDALNPQPSDSDEPTTVTSRHRTLVSICGRPLNLIHGARLAALLIWLH